MKSDDITLGRRGFLQALAAATLMPATALGADKRPSVYITIDDGPGPNMVDIFSRLRSKDKVTFFMIGNLMDCESGFDMVCRALDAGHQVGSHTYSHSKLSQVSFDEAVVEIDRAAQLVSQAYKAVGREDPKLFRFPYNNAGGKNKEAIVKFLKESGLRHYGWDVDPRDWQFYSRTNKRSLETIMRSLKGVKDGQSILFHDRPLTVERLIPYFVDNNYELKALPK